MTQLKKIARRRQNDRKRGQGMTEYIIIVGLIAIVLIAAVGQFKGALEKTYQGAAAEIETDVLQKIQTP